LQSSHPYNHENFSFFFTILLLLWSSHVRAEVGETDVIDVIAIKPGGSRAILLLYQARSWDEQSLSLLQRKLAYYFDAISSGALLNERPEVAGKEIRIIVAYRETPSPDALKVLEKAASDMHANNISLKWGTSKQVINLAETP